jgi:hypothetical protein
MGMIADNMAEVIERSQGDPTGLFLELRQAGTIEFLGDEQGRVWVNIDGTLVLRIAHVDSILVDTSAMAAKLEKVIKE